MKVALTGASGHIGISIMDELQKRGHVVKALAHEDASYFEKNNIEFVKGHVNDEEAIRSLLESCDALIHSAAVISINGGRNGVVRKVNVDGVRNVMGVALSMGISRVVHISSIHAYLSLPKDEVLDESRVFVPDSAFEYDKSKRDGQRVVMEMVEKGLNAIIVNPTSVTGPPENKMSYQGKAVLDIYQGRIPAIFNGGFDWVDVRDVTQSICNGLTMGEAGENYLLSGKYYTMRQLIDIVASVKGKPIRIPTIPVWLARVGLPFVKLQSIITGKEPLYTVESIDVLVNGNMNVSHEKAKRDLKHNPRPFEDTLRDLVSWFKENGYIEE